MDAGLSEGNVEEATDGLKLGCPDSPEAAVGPREGSIDAEKRAVDGLKLGWLDSTIAGVGP